MKRADQLQPLSRQHHLGLNLSRHAKQCLDTPQDIDKHWQNLTTYLNEMQSHFESADHSIKAALQPYKDTNPKVAAVLATLNEQQRALRTFMTDISNGEKLHTVTAKQVRELGNLLYDHMRFKERELFLIAQEFLNNEQLDNIYDASADNVKRIDENR